MKDPSTARLSTMFINAQMEPNSKLIRLSNPSLPKFLVRDKHDGSITRGTRSYDPIYRAQVQMSSFKLTT